jgi:hypothetical protein
MGEKLNWSQPCSTLLRRVVRGCVDHDVFELCARAKRGEAEDRLERNDIDRPRSIAIVDADWRTRWNEPAPREVEEEGMAMGCMGRHSGQAMQSIN